MTLYITQKIIYTHPSVCPSKRHVWWQLCVQLEATLLCLCFSQDAFSSRNDEFSGFDDGFVLTGLPEPPKPVAPSFKNPSSDIDLFGLGFEDTACKSKDSSDDPDGNNFQICNNANLHLHCKSPKEICLLNNTSYLKHVKLVKSF